MKEIISLNLENDMDLVVAHRRSMQLAEACGMNLTAQTSLATAVSEVGRFVIEKGNKSMLVLGLAKLAGGQPVIYASIKSPLTKSDSKSDKFRFAQRLVSHFEVTASSVTVSCELPKQVALNNTLIEKCTKFFDDIPPISPYEEVRRKNVELRQLSDNLLESDTRYHDLTNSLPLMMFSLGPDYKMLYANKEFLTFTERSLNSLQQGSWVQWIQTHNINLDTTYLLAKLEQKHAFQQEVLLEPINGEKVWYLLSLTPQFNPPGNLLQWFGFIVNIHAQKVVDQTIKDNQELVQIKEMMEIRQKQLDNTIDELNRSNQELARYAYVASHDLQEPTRKVMLLADMLTERYTSLVPREGIDLLKRLRGSAERMQHVVRDLLTYSKLNSANALLKENVELSKIVHMALDNLEYLVQDKQASVTLTDSRIVTGNSVQLLLLFQNLIANAIKFTSAGVKPVILITADDLSESEVTSLGLSSTNRWLNIQVIDNGIGFDPNYASKIFEVFQRLHTKSEYEGTGIGLSICKKIAEIHGGNITAKSSPGQGSIFALTLPRQSVLRSS